MRCKKASNLHKVWLFYWVEIVIVFEKSIILAKGGREGGWTQLQWQYLIVKVDNKLMAYNQCRIAGERERN